jgi:hypothetical protein
MMAVLRYVVCVLVTFSVAAYAVSVLIEAAFVIPYAYQSWWEHPGPIVFRTDAGWIGAEHIFTSYLFPIALCLTLCVVAWRYRQPK